MWARKVRASVPLSRLYGFGISCVLVCFLFTSLMKIQKDGELSTSAVVQKNVSRDATGDEGGHLLDKAAGVDIASDDELPDEKVSQDNMRDEGHLDKVLRMAGVDVTSADHPDIMLTAVPKLWDQIKDLYYNRQSSRIKRAGPIILGTEKCEDFRKLAGPNATIGMAGLFNTGSTAFLRNMQRNLGLPGKHVNDEWDLDGIMYEVPWWKHNPDIDQNWECCGRNPNKHKNILPIVIVRDPFMWRQSMCSARYTIRWKRAKRGTCPKVDYNTKKKRKKQGSHSFSPTPIDFNIELVPIPKTVQYESLVDLWNKWYRNYFDADFPRLIIRFEDSIFYLPEILEQVRQCVGAYSKLDTFEMMSGVPKFHGNRGSNFMTTLLKTADPRRRVDMTDAELEYSLQALDTDMMESFGYTLPKREDQHVGENEDELATALSFYAEKAEEQRKKLRKQIKEARKKEEQNKL